LRLSLLIPLLLAMSCYMLPARAEDASETGWQDCRKAPRRACLLDEATRLLELEERSDKRATIIASVAQVWAKAGEIDKAAQLAAQLPNRMQVRIAVLREIAAAQERAARRAEAQVTFDQALQLAYGMKDKLERAEALEAIAEAQAAVGLAAAADTTTDQALQSVLAVSIKGEPGRITLPSAEQRAAQLLVKIARHELDAGDIAHALRIARTIPFVADARARALLTVAERQDKTGTSPDDLFDEALAVLRDPEFDPTQWPSRSASGIAVQTESGMGRLHRLCDIARAQARAGLVDKAIASFNEALQTARTLKPITPSPWPRERDIATALAAVADAQRQAGLPTAARASLQEARDVTTAITSDLYRVAALAHIAAVQVKIDGPSSDPFGPALALAGLLPRERERLLALQWIAEAEADADQRDAAAHTFSTAAWLAGQDDHRTLTNIAEAERRAGLIPEAATTFEKALAAAMLGDEQARKLPLLWLINGIARDRGSDLITAYPPLGRRLAEAVGAIDRASRANILATIARVFPE
jgi:tetratricopeptide (TPR) repeat protein